MIFCVYLMWSENWNIRRKYHISDQIIRSNTFQIVTENSSTWIETGGAEFHANLNSYEQSRLATEVGNTMSSFRKGYVKRQTRYMELNGKDGLLKCLKKMLEARQLQANSTNFPWFTSSRRLNLRLNFIEILFCFLPQVFVILFGVENKFTTYSWDSAVQYKDWCWSPRGANDDCKLWHHWWWGSGHHQWCGFQNAFTCSFQLHGSDPLIMKFCCPIYIPVKTRKLGMQDQLVWFWCLSHRAECYTLDVNKLHKRK